LSLVDVETPDPGPGEVRIDVEAVALNRLDVFARTGHPGEEGAFPKRTGCDVAGTVDAVGDGVPDSRIGEAVLLYPGVTCISCC
jgi:NADPH2:quinone reductase